MAPPVKKLKRPRKPSSKISSAARIRKLKIQYPEFSESDISKVVGCDVANVHGVLARFQDELLGGNTREEIAQFRSLEADALTSLRKRTLGSITDTDISKSPFVARLTGYGIAFDKERLLMGQATSINVNVLLDAVAAVKESRKTE